MAFRNPICSLLAIAFLAIASSVLHAADRELWFYYPTNLQVDANVDKLEPIWHRAAAAGYSKVMLSDSKFARLGTLPDRYFKNVDRVKTLAKELHLEIVPAVFPIGYSNDLLFHDPNLAEGLTVVDAPFVVKDNVATPTWDDTPIELAKPAWKDDVVAIDKGIATVGAFEGNARFVYKLDLPKFRAYHVCVDIRTEEFTGEPRIAAIAEGGRSLQYTNLGAKPTQDWTTHHVVFNTLDFDKINLYFGSWGGAKGKLQWRNWKIEPAGLVNLVRRPGAPLSIEGLTEGKDFEEVIDPLSGTKPYNGEFTVWHEPPLIHLKKKLPDGTTLKVSYTLASIIYDGQVAICLSELKTNELLQDQAKRMTELWQAKTYMMSHDEIRVGGWDAACVNQKLDAGQILANNVRDCTKWITQSGATSCVWSDMFDPSHNAVKDYYLTRGDLAGSWEGLDPKVTIVNWNGGKRDESLKFFADRGHHQVIAGYYDGPVDGIRDWIKSADAVKNVDGIMYTTWVSNYENLEAFAKICREK